MIKFKFCLFNNLNDILLKHYPITKITHFNNLRNLRKSIYINNNNIKTEKKLIVRIIKSGWHL